jgi:hypothetical protein
MDNLAETDPNTRDKLPALGDFLDRLENVRRVGDAYKAQCPLHDSKSGQNLSVTEKNGQVLTYCHSQQCKFEDIVAALYKKTYTRARVYKGRVFEYTDLAGDVVAVHKHKGSWFLPYGDIWIAKEPANRPIYNLPEVAEGVKTKQTVYIVEGEKDAETARGLGLVATTSGGANTWGRVTPTPSSSLLTRSPRFASRLGGKRSIKRTTRRLSPCYPSPRSIRLRFW